MGVALYTRQECSACGYLPLNGDDMFDPSAPHIIILLVVVLLLFGSRRLPGAAKSLGESMHIFKKSVHGQDENGQPFDQAATPASATAQPAAAPPPALPAATASYDGVSQQQLADLQRQVADLQRQNAGVQDSVPSTTGGPAPEASRSQQPF
jgi:sec-independent protein translocase protein TatA